MNKQGIIQQGKHAFMMGRGLRLSERGTWQVLDAENPFTDSLARKLWDIGYREAKDNFYKVGRERR